MAELVRLGRHARELADAGVRVVAVSADDAATIRDRQASLGLPFELVSDRGPLMDALGLRHAGAGPGGTDAFYSTLLLLDAGGVVRWRYVTPDVRARATPEEILAAARAH